MQGLTTWSPPPQEGTAWSTGQKRNKNVSALSQADFKGIRHMLSADGTRAVSSSSI